MSGRSGQKLVAAAILACSLVAATMWGLDAVFGYEQFLHPGGFSDFVNLGIFMEKMENPELYPRDYLHASPDMYRFYTPSYRWLLKLLAVPSGDWRNGLLLLVPMLGFLFVATTALWLRLFSRSLLVVCVLSLTASVPHFLPGFDAWGSGGIGNALPRTVFASVASLVLLIHIRIGGTIKGAGWSLGLAGLVTNLHPVTGSVLGQVLIVDRSLATVRHRFDLRGLPLALGAYAAGAAPFLSNFFLSRALAQGKGSSVDPAAFWQAVQVRFPRMLFPPDFSDAWPFLTAVLPVTVFAVIGAVMVGFLSPTPHDDQEEDRRAAVRSTLQLIGALLLVVFGGQIVLQVLARSIGWSLMTIDQIRGLRLIYPMLFGLSAAGLDEMRLRLGKWVGHAVVLAAGVLMVPIVQLPQVTPTLMHLPRPAKILAYILLGRGDRVPASGYLAKIPAATLALEEAARWARDHTPPEARFLTDDSRFRLFSERSVAFGFKDGGIAYYLGQGPFLEWARREKLVVNARSSGRPKAWTDLARALECEYAVVKLEELKNDFQMALTKDAGVVPHDYQLSVYREANPSGRIVFRNDFYVIYNVTASPKSKLTDHDP